MNIRTFKNLTPWTYRASWGACNMKEHNGTLTMEVKGRRYTGKVCVKGEGPKLSVTLSGRTFRCWDTVLAHEMDIRIES